MRRLVLFLLLALLPIQISWAAISDYCAHEPARTAQHSGHHTHELAALFVSGDVLADEPHALPGSETAPDSGHDHCHLAGFVGLLGDTAFMPSMPRALPIAGTDKHAVASPVLDRPERPKWSRLA